MKHPPLIITKFLLVLALSLLAGCAGKAVAPSAESSATPALSMTAIDISYTLERSQYRITTHEDDSGKIHVLSTLDGETLQKSVVDPQHFQAFAAKTLEFFAVTSDHRAPAQAKSCHGPYHVAVVQVQAQTTSLLERQGCRNTDNGALSRLVRQGEILLYSKK
jgi:hypothetical protein